MVATRENLVTALAWAIAIAERRGATPENEPVLGDCKAAYYHAKRILVGPYSCSVCGTHWTLPPTGACCPVCEAPRCKEVFSHGDQT